MKEEAVRLWEIYAASVSPDPITRIGTRYINVLKLPLNTELKDAPIVLDIDVYIARQFEPQAQEFWHSLDQLREFKNTVFFESITEKSMELFQ